MRYQHLMAWVLLNACLSPVFGLAQEEKVDLTMMQKIREEGLQHSKVMDIALHLTDLNGNRLTNSPGFLKAANYAKETLSSWGLTNASLDPWGEFGKGWELEKSYLAMTAPFYKPLLAYPKTWTIGTSGSKSASLVLVNITDSASVLAYKGKLRGKIIVIDDYYGIQITHIVDPMDRLSMVGM